MAGLLGRVAEARDKQAFSELFTHYGPRLKSFMLRKGSPTEEAEDLVQETMIAVWRKAHLYASDKGSVTTWVYTVARNLRIDRYRRNGAVHLTGLDDYDEAADDTPSDDVVNRSQEDSLVRAALAELPGEQSEILRLSYIQDMPQSEIAEKLNIPLGTVKSRMRLAYRRMRRGLEDLA